MGNLTAKQDNFCLQYIKTGNATNAYKLAYDCDNMKDTTANRKAKELMDNGKITARIAEFKAPVIAEAQITLASHINRLKHLSSKAEEVGNLSAAIKAEELIGKASGLYTNKLEVGGNVKIVTTPLSSIFET